MVIKVIHAHHVEELSHSIAHSTARAVRCLTDVALRHKTAIFM